MTAQGFGMLSFFRRRPRAHAVETPAAPRVDEPAATEEDIRWCFRLLFGREVSPEEWPGYRSRAGEPLATVVRSFLNAKGFRDRNLLGADVAHACRFVDVHGKSVALLENDLDIGRHLLATGVHEPHVTALFRRELRRGMHVFDVGANIGYFTALSLACVGPSGRVWAIEPNAHNVRLLEIARRRNEAANLAIVAAAAGDSFAPLRLDAAYSNGMATPLADTPGDLADVTVVCQVPLDAVVGAEERVDFVKLDVEGFEYRALRGFQRALDRCSPSIVCEFAPGMLSLASGVSGRDFIDFLMARHYAVGTIEPTGEVAFHGSATAVLEAFQRSGVDHVDLFARRGG